MKALSVSFERELSLQLQCIHFPFKDDITINKTLLMFNIIPSKPALCYDYNRINMPKINANVAMSWGFLFIDVMLRHKLNGCINGVVIDIARIIS